MRFAAIVLLLVALLAQPAQGAILPPDMLDPWAVGHPSVVTVQRGDVLSELFAHTPGGWARAAYVNDLESPDLIFPGQKLRVPIHDGPRWTPPRVVPAASRSSSPGPVVVAASTSSDGLNWLALFQCESGNNPRAVSASGTYRGLAQFDLATWQSVGMSGDPIDHSYAVQAEAARRLYAARGRSPWPHCGALL